LFFNKKGTVPCVLALKKILSATVSRQAADVSKGWNVIAALLPTMEDAARER
jgi:hypothetical protein